MSCGCIATIPRSDTRAKAWKDVLGSLSIPVVPRLMTVTGKTFMDVNMEALSQEQRRRFGKADASLFAIDERAVVKFCPLHASLMIA